ncbi:MAG: DUF4389 domain-containing protein [Deltaproteobacteria bacterium]|nr:DUF4389 domain-containing protein [Deltaproteobacteria bacterium]MBW2448695.1 DUF4389 domain-containing protein [Deltaproteobacteria bacterium]
MTEPATPPAPPAPAAPPAPSAEAKTERSRGRTTGEIDRGATGIRIALTLLFAIIARVVELLLTVLVLFELGFTLVTQQPPRHKIRDFANQVCTYLYRVTRYLTYNEAEPPFPFTDFPVALEAPTEDYDEAH